MDATASSFSTRGNAKRSAEKLVAEGTAPATDYGIKRRGDGRFQLLWKTEDIIAESAEASQAQPTEPDSRHMVGSTEGGTRPSPDQNPSKVETEIARAAIGYAYHRTDRIRSRLNAASRRRPRHTPPRNPIGLTGLCRRRRFNQSMASVSRRSPPGGFPKNRRS
jgi:hypothetical protein